MLREAALELDEADIAILRAVQGDARRSMRELARISGVSTPTASSKVKSLEAKGVLRGYGAQLGPDALGQHVLMLHIKVRPSDVEGVAVSLAALPEVRACHVMTPHRVVAFVTLLDPALEAEFHAKLAKVAAIESYESLLFLRTVKDLPLALIDRGVTLAVRCEFCGRRTKDDALRLRSGEVTRFVCCESCKTGLEERMARLAKLTGKGRATDGRKPKSPRALRPAARRSHEAQTGRRWRRVEVHGLEGGAGLAP